jgi:hydrogenase maturation factor HypF (carbamoyltransferase family)
VVADLDAARALAHVPGAEAELLTSPARPIVLVARRQRRRPPLIPRSWKL